MPTLAGISFFQNASSFLFFHFLPCMADVIKKICFRNACSKSITQHKKIVKFFFEIFLGLLIYGIGFSCEK
jgi:hypothetical protein